MGMQYRVLLVDTNKNYIEKLKKTLTDNRFNTHCIDSGQLVVEHALKQLPHLILLEIEMPDIDGIELCKLIRKTPELADTFIVFLSNHEEDFIQVAAFKAGCDDFILKTIKPRLLIFRIEALLKRHFEKKWNFPYDDFYSKDRTFYIDTEKFLVVVGDKNIYLPKKQFQILQYLSSQPSRAFSRKIIYSSIWGQNSTVGLRTIDVYIRKIREQIGIRYIKTIKGVGYRFE
jgi:two-component system alkaline phosphatase synthesis response regulator PhoP